MARTILTYHAIASGPELGATTVTPSRFRKHIAALETSGCTFERLDAVKHGKDDDDIVVTFDDGYDSVMDVAFPEIVRRNGRATVFIPTKHIGRPASWDVGAVRKHRHMDWHALRQLADAGWEIGSHGVSHRALTDMPEDEAFRELTVSRNEIEQRIGVTVTSFSYPFGAFTPRLARLAQEAGYRRAVTMKPRRIPNLPYQLRLPRWPVYRFDRSENLLARIAGPEWIRSLESAKVQMIQSFARGTRVRMMGNSR